MCQTPSWTTLYNQTHGFAVEHLIEIVYIYVIPLAVLYDILGAKKLIFCLLRTKLSRIICEMRRLQNTAISCCRVQPAGNTDCCRVQPAEQRVFAPKYRLHNTHWTNGAAIGWVNTQNTEESSADVKIRVFLCDLTNFVLKWRHLPFSLNFYL